MKPKTSFEIMTYNKGRIHLNISGPLTYNETSTVSKTLVFRSRKKFQDCFTNHKDGSRPGQPKTAVINANGAAVTGAETPD